MDAPTQRYVFNATVTNVVDGDTVDVVVQLGFHASMVQRFRLADVNCPEVHGPTRAAGLAAAAFARDHLQGKEVLIQTRKSDDFGRWLARIWIEGGVDFNGLLVSSGHAVPYREGGSGV